MYCTASVAANKGTGRTMDTPVTRDYDWSVSWHVLGMQSFTRRQKVGADKKEGDIDTSQLAFRARTCLNNNSKIVNFERLIKRDNSM